MGKLVAYLIRFAANVVGKMVVYLIRCAACMLWETPLFIRESLLPVCYGNTRSLFDLGCCL